ncbi:MAG: DUF6444 domain-containing protein [Pseudonocardia sp.]|nr:DUF6444 domain-containing protein [Pseudonocardia sp.]
MSDPSSSSELSALVAQLRKANSGLREVIAGQATQLETQTAQLEAQAARIAELERRLDADSSTSSKPPSSDPPYRKPQRRSSRRSSGRKPGQQPGTPGSTMPLIDDPTETIICDPGWCGDCGTDLAGALVLGVQRRQVTDVVPPPPPRVTEYRVLTRACPGCAGHQSGPAPAAAPARAQYGPGVSARAAELLCGHYLPVSRAARLMDHQLSVTKRAELRGRISTMPGLNRFLRVTPKGLLRVDRKKTTAETKLDGKYLLRCSDPHLSAEDIALGYKQLLQVERGWRDMKTTLELRPVYHRLEDRIRAHVILCWLALLLVRIVETTTGDTWNQVRDDLQELHVGTFEGPAGTFRQRTELSAAQRDILTKLGIDTPKKIIELGPATTP